MSRLLALILALIAVPALAQPVPTDIAAHETYSARTITYAAGTANMPVVGDGSSTGGVAPETGLTPIDLTTEERTALTEPANSFCLTEAEGGTCAEAKFRTHANISHVLYDDPIRNFGQPGASHCHMFFGNKEVNAFSTYASLRTLTGARDGSVAKGLMRNATGYWFPCVIKQIATVNYAVPPKFAVIYYAHGATTATGDTDNLHTLNIPGLRYVSGYNMDNPNKMADLVASANAANAAAGGSSSRYRLHNNSGDHEVNYHNWKCNGVSSDHLRNANDTDPFGGACTAGQALVLEFNASSCWDGEHLHSPGGYDHIIPTIYDTVATKKVCPLGWYMFPELQLQLQFDHGGPTDYMNWRLSSDDHAEMVSGGEILNGASFHTDWMYGWDSPTIAAWNDNCLGVQGQVSHECGDSAYSATERLLNSPDLNDAVDTSDPAQLFRLPDEPNGPGVFHVHGN